MSVKRGGHRRRDPKLEARWRRLVAAWERSGRTALAFCRRRRINEQAFYSWRRILRERDAARQEPVSFVPVEVIPAPPGSAAEASIEVVLGETIVRVRPTADMATLRCVLSAVREVGC